jgi:hypothetical protein
VIFMRCVSFKSNISLWLRLDRIVSETHESFLLQRGSRENDGPVQPGYYLLAQLESNSPLVGRFLQDSGRPPNIGKISDRLGFRNRRSPQVPLRLVQDCTKAERRSSLPSFHRFCWYCGESSTPPSRWRDTADAGRSAVFRFTSSLVKR